MGSVDFASPLFVRTGRNLVQEVASTGDAIDFLLDWTETRHDILAETLLRACYDVQGGRKPVATVERGFEHFARRAGVLEDPLAAIPWMTAGRRGGGHVPA
ncbi:DUF982 domain-containing protein [Jiella sp. M17.18]|uniref:DUF982 domain-containing protein n=1 Tax=Jiella sp. M17.18 TaxID=3234247 RepID=UPI0034DEDC52